MKQRLLNISKILLIALFVSYYGGTTLFFHTHETAEGLISHSHPYKAGHSHSQVEFETIHLLSVILLTAYSAFFLSFIRLLYRILHSPKNIVCIHLRSLTSNPLRAPPFTA
ncbi:hypothetical protein [uncultured Bacteroides sp.]|uniref:hypothetical protein n=1 Tax=uncultured Bacteroides sp. TaxID=162156 RepID=UPI002AA88323|nr:hypothetical protein [uncultured Bacteroides sp.]